MTDATNSEEIPVPRNGPLDAVQLEALEISIYDALSEHEDAGGRFTVDLYNVVQTSDGDDKVYAPIADPYHTSNMRPVCIVGAMVLGHVAMFDIFATARAVYDLTAFEVDSIEAGWTYNREPRDDEDTGCFMIGRRMAGEFLT